jgi:hypothetical protein
MMILRLTGRVNNSATHCRTRGLSAQAISTGGTDMCNASTVSLLRECQV